jgi:hypothetical protein
MVKALIKRKPHSKDSCDSVAAEPRKSVITFFSKTGERAMSTLTAVVNGFAVSGAHRIIANLSLSPSGTKCVFQAKFLRAAAIGNNSLSGSLTRDLPDGTKQFNSIALNATATSPIVAPLGVFSGRQASWTIKDLGVNRTLAVTVTSIDGLGTDEVWHLEIVANQADGSAVDFEVKSTPAPATITSVDVTP